MATLEKALEIAINAHKGQKDKAGMEYILHPIRVMLRGETEIEKICGILHDVIEDSNLTFEDLRNEGFSEEVISVLKLLTKESENEDYDKFIERVKQNPIAVKVKINDLLDNLDITRLKELNDRDLKRLNKYLKAYWTLKTFSGS
ncbi:MAG: phosphohydrolase [Ignavibacteria bacterium]|nr:phosphohydrolase [Ignavibacteria bacterium]